MKNYKCRVCGLEAVAGSRECTRDFVFSDICIACNKKGENVVTWSHDTDKTDAENKKANKWHAFQSFVHQLELDEIKKIRRHIIAIEKEIFF